MTLLRKTSLKISVILVRKDSFSNKHERPPRRTIEKVDSDTKHAYYTLNIRNHDTKHS